MHEFFCKNLFEWWAAFHVMTWTAQLSQDVPSYNNENSNQCRQAFTLFWRRFSRLIFIAARHSRLTLSQGQHPDCTLRGYFKTQIYSLEELATLNQHAAHNAAKAAATGLSNLSMHLIFNSKASLWLGIVFNSNPVYTHVELPYCWTKPQEKEYLTVHQARQATDKASYANAWAGEDKEATKASQTANKASHTKLEAWEGKD